MHRSYSVRRLRGSDLDRILQIEHASFGKHAWDRKLFADIFHNCGDLFLAVEGDHTVWGYMATCIRGEQAELVSVAVDPAARRHGAASLLMDSTLRRLRLRGIVRIRLMVKVSNRKARAFYEKYGFEKVRIVAKYYEDGSDGLLMAKKLG